MGAMERRLIGQDPDYSKVETTALVLLEFLVPLVRDVEAALVTNIRQQSLGPKVGDASKCRCPESQYICPFVKHHYF